MNNADGLKSVKSRCYSLFQTNAILSHPKLNKIITQLDAKDSEILIHHQNQR